jgi:hypothetical protein
VLPSICTAPARCRGDRVRHPEPEVLVAVEADLRVVPELGAQRGDPVAHLLEHERARGVDDVHAPAAGVGHDPRLLRQRLGRRGVRHHEEADGLEPEVAREAEVLDGDVRLGAVRRDPADRGAVAGGGTDVVQHADAGQHEERDLRLRRGLHRGLDQLLLRRVAQAVGERRPAEAVAVRHLDDGDAGGVEGADDRRHVLDGELVQLRVRPVAQRRVGDAEVEVVGVRLRQHGGGPPVLAVRPS